MANVHVLNNNDADYTVVMHIPIPQSNNTAGVSWQTVVANSGRGGTTILKDGDGTKGTISSAEKAQITSGAIVEVVMTLRLGSFLTPTVDVQGLNAYLDAQFTQATSNLYAKWGIELGAFGYTH